jgi:hypothetical protein
MQKCARNERGEMDGWDVLGTVFWVVAICVVVFGVYKWIQYENRMNDLADARYAATHDKHVYTITGELLAPPNSLVRQSRPANGHLSGGIVGGVGGVSGQFSGEQLKGKNFVRLAVNDASPASNEATPGHDALLKTVDTKTIALSQGDTATFACLRQYERVGDVGHVWEFDDCRVVSFQAAP